ncbi:hypothetical protein [Duganella callida]|uniref:Uncharacterized protein n=1 Tax=Duganella callida TaxID=2561932 RepID=A0A4Y9S3K2_9BURK|nr:hypothetical protein [Duganella callida]TFW15928.1 hypothetical protein E4L98_24850 [Duganella callida]
MSAVELQILGAVGRTLREMPQARDLELLGKIDQTLKAVADQTVKFQSMSLMVDSLIDPVQKAKFPNTDKLVEVEAAFVSALPVSEKYYDTVVAMRQSAVDDKRLTEDDGIVEAYDALVEQAAAYHNSLSNLAWIIGEQIVDAEETVPLSFEDADDMFASMGV